MGLPCWLALLTLFGQSGLGVTQDVPAFDLEAWKAGPGSRKSLKDWGKENPSPWRSYFNADSTDCAKRWFVNLGPLGVRTLMHDRTWGVFKGCREIFPQALTDEHRFITPAPLTAGEGRFSW